ncbi:hypothetical protein DL769_001147 [Monosporascus sp. CRB-8-3]|nr:hypothetical protein DL769_001147 [Monosporascus sp. CRB-8-3]
MASITLFILGSGIAGGAWDSATLISGRTIQGIGTGGLYVLLDIVCCDLVPQRQRGKYLGPMNSFAGIAAALGPALGGAIAQASWRWIFYMNIPISGVAIIGVWMFMRMVKGPRNSHLGHISKFRQVDYIGNILFIPSVLAVLLGLVMGGIQYPWSSWHVIVPLVLGATGWVAFHIQQHYSETPSVPTRLFRNRTSAAGYILTFLSSILIQAISYFLPIYFQGVLGESVLQSGTYFLPYAIGTLFFAIVGGVLLSKTGTYSILHATAFALSAVGTGLLTLLDATTPKVTWAFFQLITSAGLGITVSTILPSIMAGLPESDVAVATAAYAFIKTFGYVWGVSIASIIFNAVLNANLDLVLDSALRQRLADGAAYAFASEVHQLLVDRDLPWEIRQQIQQVYIISLRAIWWASLGTSMLGFCIVWVEKDLELRNVLDTEYGLKDAQVRDVSDRRAADEEANGSSPADSGPPDDRSERLPSKEASQSRD